MLEIMMIKLRTELKYWSPKCVTSFMNINWIGSCWCWHTALHSCLPQKQLKKKSWQWGMNIFSQPSPTLATLKCWSLLWCARTKIKLPQKENSVRMKCDGSDVDKYSPAVPWDLWKNQVQTCQIVKIYRKTKSNKNQQKNVDGPTWWPNTPELQESHKPRPHLCSRRLVALGKKFWNFNLDLIQTLKSI